MNEITKISSPKMNKSPFNYNLLIIGFLAIPILKNTFFKNKSLDRIISDVNIRSIQNKVEIVKKVGPYLPEQVVSTINTYMPMYEKVSSIIGLMEILNSNKSFTPIKPVTNLNQNDKMNKIFTLVKDELPNDTLKSVKPLLDIVTNIDKYKVILDLLASFNDPNKKSFDMENLIDIIVPLMGGADNKNAEKMQDMVKMMELVNILNSDDDKDDAKDNEDTKSKEEPNKENDEDK
ncbi:MAG: hypothetical protein FH753_04900 [Firmicutes bacterium]|nr:hypothetical protein [Bacillota bacterium]